MDRCEYVKNPMWDVQIYEDGKCCFEGCWQTFSNSLHMQHIARCKGHAAVKCQDQSKTAQALTLTAGSESLSALRCALNLPRCATQKTSSGVSCMGNW